MSFLYRLLELELDPAIKLCRVHVVMYNLVSRLRTVRNEMVCVIVKSLWLPSIANTVLSIKRN